MVSTNLLADTVLFDTINRGPASTLQIDGITITGDLGNGPEVTVAGSGLGYANGPGLYPSVSRSSQGDETLGFHFSVNGIINSITVLPFAFDQNDNPIPMPFTYSEQRYYLIDGVYQGVDPNYSVYVQGSSGPGLYAAPVGIGVDAAQVDINLFDDFGGASEGSYLRQHPNVTSFTIGYTIESADVTFAPLVPDQSSTWVLLALSGGALFLVNCFRRCA
jgi:hypothetical protein